MARLVESINLKKLAEEGVEFTVDSNFVKDDYRSDSDDDSNNPADLFEQKLKLQTSKECIGVFDEDLYEEGEPFEIIGKKMFNLVPNGKIKKRVLRSGSNEKPLEYASVKINYNAYVEYDEKPFDSTYARDKPRKFTLGDGQVLAGLDFAVQSMTLNEKSQFLIHPDYAYGRNCFIGRVPPNATVLFEVELLEIVNSGAAVTYEKLPEEKQKLFSEVYNYCSALAERGNNSYKAHDLKKAIRDYNTAATKLEKVMLNSQEEVEKHRDLLLRLYSNLLICYTRNQESRKGCAAAKKIYNLTEDSVRTKISAKVYFNHAKCLRFLCDYEDAKVALDKAYRLEPRNPEIANEMLNLENDRLEHKKKQTVFAKALVGKVETTSANN